MPAASLRGIQVSAAPNVHTSSSNYIQHVCLFVNTIKKFILRLRIKGLPMGDLLSARYAAARGRAPRPRPRGRPERHRGVSIGVGGEWKAAAGAPGLDRCEVTCLIRKAICLIRIEYSGEKRSKDKRETSRDCQRR